MSDRQGSLFGPAVTARDLYYNHPSPAPEPADPNVKPEDRPRLKTQNQQILERLRQGPATAADLAAIALKYTSRISDLRKAGHRIEQQSQTCGSASRDLYVLLD